MTDPYGYPWWVPASPKSRPRSVKIYSHGWLGSAGPITHRYSHGSTHGYPWLIQTHAQPYSATSTNFLSSPPPPAVPTLGPAEAPLPPLPYTVAHFPPSPTQFLYNFFCGWHGSGLSLRWVFPSATFLFTCQSHCLMGSALRERYCYKPFIISYCSYHRHCFLEYIILI